MRQDSKEPEITYGKAEWRRWNPTYKTSMLGGWRSDTEGLSCARENR